jgi:hypothetical protein
MGPITKKSSKQKANYEFIINIVVDWCICDPTMVVLGFRILSDQKQRQLGPAKTLPPLSIAGFSKSFQLPRIEKQELI